MSDDRRFMWQAIDLARRGRGYVSPNPLVGCLIVKGGRIVSSGYHERYGAPHAESNALEAAGDDARAATMYVTLEPCCHDGPGKKTPPCAPAIIDAGIHRVVIAVADPNPEVSGRGAAMLRDAGIVAETGLLEDEARELNAPYLSLISRRRPWLTAKWAMTLDGKIATVSGDSKWITSEEARMRANEERGCSDAVMVGIGTALRDDPMLNNRSSVGRQPLRVVIDPRLELPADSQLVKSAREFPLLVITCPDAPSKHRGALRSMGADVVDLPPNDKGRIPWRAILALFGERKIASVLLEGGSGLITDAVEQRVVDAAMVFVAPVMVGGKDAPSPVAGKGVNLMSGALRLDRVKTYEYGRDIALFGNVVYPDEE
ncbi:MAG: bifunctional diaminohydroxyphosphoribosylaminopyrimidine deaminase/5-amino-6-(5-phosphoribosylamino)uracil reductase RibD [Planctomycetes bacterium]|nr:bifunctional diaminohydroxyphosphoribosylaminopyrimidine deaminase/5-amino-6-(5-phosphoribosylamino)uracil reductase RibD [Planctomycetota bacterium]NUQ34825.1 bifunctional diaminohydroxyphosphoribosylaminopyrimidine deaminase/5-amino-6-(5-phosphoribosylamino)uracil reductase RibD [Planctomycetaceae bacterium]